jgi:plasmid stability protein
MVSYQLHSGTKMPVNLSIKNVSDDLAERLRRRAAGHHRSLQGELMAILEASVAEGERLGAKALLGEVRASGLRTPAESARLVRVERDARSRR